MLDVQKELFRYAQGKGAHALISPGHVVLLEVGWCDVLTIRYLIAGQAHLAIERVFRYSGRIFYRPKSFALLENSL